MPPLPAYAELDPTLPIVLLPVRLETRYFQVDADHVELRVRIFPSSAHVATDRPGVDPLERDESQAYWRTRLADDDGAATTRAASARLGQLFGEPRAQWLRRRFTPASAPAPDGSAVFPDVPLNDPSATALLVSEATALPTRFVVSGLEGAAMSFRVTGAVVRAAVVVGPHGAPDAIRWQTDFAAAEAIGLAVRVPLGNAAAAALTQLLVFGLREGADAASSPQALAALLDRHAGDDGAALVTAGTPTNHTPAMRVAPLSPASGETPAPGSDGARLADALGIAPAAFGAVGGSTTAAGAAGIALAPDGTGAAQTADAAAALHTALWPATLGYFLEVVMAPLLDDTARERGRALFCDFVRPRGPFAALALGTHPYGVLPVSSIALWRAADGAADPFAGVLGALRSTWRTAAARVPRLGASADPGDDLVALLASSPVSTRWLARPLESTLTAQREFADADPARLAHVVDLARAERVAAELTPVGLAGTPHALDFLFHADAFGVHAPLVAPAGAPKDAPLPANYIAAMATAGVDALKNDGVVGAAPRTLLYLLLRHATLLVMARTIDHFSISTATPAGPTRSRAATEAVFIDTPGHTVWTTLKTPVPELAHRSLSDIFDGALPSHAAFTELARHRAALGALAGWPVGELERLAAETLDACSHRLDAWITALATERLAALRTAAPAASHLGAWAWQEAPPLPSTLPRDGDAPADDPDSEGFVHAPGLAHARTAAILRAAFLAREREAAQAPLAVDLSSDRVRAARWLLDAVRGGARVAALLGERIERWMIEQRQGPQLAALRDDCPLDDGSGRTRIDGLKVAQRWQAAPPTGGLAPVAALLADLTDAVSDLLLAEAVHQQASGRPTAAQPALAALDTGVAMPSGFDVVRTQADSVTRAWRLVLPLSTDAVADWVAGWLGPAALQSALTATVGSGAVGTAGSGMGTSVPPTRTLTLGQLRTLPGFDGVLPSLLDFVRHGTTAPALKTAFRQAAGAGATTVTFSPALEAALGRADALARLLRSARPLDASDIGAGRAALPGLASASAQKEWLHDLARVRPGIDALDALDFHARADGRALGLRFIAADSRVNIVSIGPLPATGPVEGLLLESWNETTPGLETTTGIAMHYDAPRSRAPQAILLAVPPTPGTPWSMDTLQAVLLETAELARLRMVRPADVHGSFLPALYLADNLDAETVATDFYRVSVVAQFKDA